MKLQPPSIRGLALGSGKSVSFWAGLSLQPLPVTSWESLHLPEPWFAQQANPQAYLRVLTVRGTLGPGSSEEGPQRPLQPRCQSLLGGGGGHSSWVLLNCNSQRESFQGDTSQAWER